MSVHEDWQARWGPRGVRPIGHELRSTAGTTWIRFHSLPESKRYPASEREYAELLHRHNTVINELAAEVLDRQILVFSCSWSETAEVIPREREIAAASPKGQWMTSIARDPTSWSHIYVEAFVWQPGAFDPLIRLVADEVTADVIIAPADLTWLLHPYDGGFDVIARSPEERAVLRKRHHDWLSNHPQGL